MLCPDCSRGRAKPLQVRLGGILRKVGKYSAFRFVTLTVPSVERIDRASVDGIINSFRKLRRQRFWSEVVLGGFYAVDTTWNKKYGWHVHLHVLIHLKKNVPGVVKKDGWMYGWWTDRLKKEWYALVVSDKRKTRKINVHVRRVDDGVVLELCKYLVKAASFSHVPALVGEYLDAFENVKQLQGWGSFRADKKDYPPPEDESQEFCECGNCRSPQDWRYVGVVHVSETRLLADGTFLLRGVVNDFSLSGLPPPRGKVRLN